MNIHRWLVLAALVGAPSLFAVETESWVHNSQADFEKGTLKNLSLRSDGRLALAPVFQELADPSIAYLWAIAVDSKGTVYAGGGGPNASTARLVAIDAAGKSRTVADLPGLQIQTIAIDARDRVYAATVPDGKVYRITADGKFDTFYDPKAKYIWAMAFDRRGDLLLGTGDSGEIHRVHPDGSGAVFYDTEETHVRSLVIDAKDNVIAGTEPGGLILRISPAAEGFVLYQTAKREVTALAVAPNGALYAAAVGNKGAAPAPGAPRLSVPLPAPAPAAAAAQPGARVAPVTVQPLSPAPAAPSPAVSVAGGSEVYRIGADDSPQRIWSHPQDVVYAIAFDGAGHPVLGTGNRGNIYRIDSDLISTLLIDAAPTQVTGLAAGPKARLFAVTGNVGKVYQIGPQAEKQGTYESEPLDVGSLSYWGRISHKEEANGGKVRIETRSGNLDRPHKNWSPWAAPDAASRAVSPSARFLQYRVTLEAAPDGGTPELREVEAAYMAKNVPPVLEEVEITPANYKFNPPSPLLATATRAITLPPLGNGNRASSSAPKIEANASSLAMQYAKGFVGARWAVSDPNGDDLVFKVEIRGLGENEWKLLKDNVREKYITWDSTALADGEYLLRVTASDSPGNPPGGALSAALLSDRFTIDNTPPEIVGLAGSRTAAGVTLKWSAHDARSIVRKAEYSVNGGDWQTAQPATRLADAPRLDYSVALDNPGPEATLAVRVADEFDNQAVGKVTVR